jgi:outer membrane biosynthesis protein TonB
VSDDVSLKRMLIISLLLHLLLLLIPVEMFVADMRSKALLAQQEEKLPEKMTFVFVETPENAVESPVEQVSSFFSDKNLAASNPEAPDNLDEGMPYQEGISELAEMMPEPVPGIMEGTQPVESPQESEEQKQNDPENRKRQSSYDELRDLEAMSRLAPPKKDKPLIEPGENQSQLKQGMPPIPTTPRFDSRHERAPVGSGFRLSTYNWNWAPYLEELKKRIESNLYPPPAFYMGLAHGRTFLQFKIMPDGSVQAFELLHYTGHESLKNTSVKAIEASVPFLPLPSDFPDDFLGLTVGFYYNEFIR